MTPELHIGTEGQAGLITLNRPHALNALTHAMCLQIEDAIDGWRLDPSIRLVMIDAAGDRAFCAGGDIVEMYRSGRRGNLDYGRKFWRDEYRLNAKIAEFPKPIVSFLLGYTMGGGVGIGCHAGHRIVCESSRIAMPECGIGLVPDVGGSYLLAHSPGSSGEFLAATASRMNAADAIFAGFADDFVPRSSWPALARELKADGDVNVIGTHAKEPPAGQLHELMQKINHHFCDRNSVTDIVAGLKASDTEFSQRALAHIREHSPLSVAVAVQLIRKQRKSESMRDALGIEYRFSWRAMQHGDFLEGIRARIVDKDRNPRWRHKLAECVSPSEVAFMLAPLENGNALSWEGMP